MAPVNGADFARIILQAQNELHELQAPIRIYKENRNNYII